MLCPACNNEMRKLVIEQARKTSVFCVYACLQCNEGLLNNKGIIRIRDAEDFYYKDKMISLRGTNI